MMNPNGYGRRSVLKAGAILAAGQALPTWAAAPATVPIRIDTRAVSGALPHIWSKCVGSDRAAITLRESWRQDLDRWRNEVGIRQVRFHGILGDEMGVYKPSYLTGGKAVPNFRLVDQVYDGLQARGVDPLVELSFMPKAIASGSKELLFTYGGNITPPISSEAWADFLKLFVGHLVNRYGIATVRRWPFEVWNEPNSTGFWVATQQQYFEFYKTTAVTLKSIDPQLRVGGPATAAIGWVPEFVNYCATNNAPVDFISTHVYAGDNQHVLFGAEAKMSENDVVPSAIRKVRAQIDATPLAGRPLWITEWASDSPAMIAHVISQSLPHCQMMSHWALSAEFEELGIPGYTLKEGDMGWGMMSAGIALPPFNTYKLMRRLGEQRLEATGPVLATRGEGHSVAALVWNLAEATQPSGIPGMSHTRKVIGDAKRYTIEFAGAHAGQAALISYVDQERGSPMRAWRAMGSPQYPNPQQVAMLRGSADIGPPQRHRLDAQRSITTDLPAEGVALIELV